MGCCDKKKPILVGTLILVAIYMVVSSTKNSVSKPPETPSQALISNHHLNGIGTLEQNNQTSQLWVQALIHEPLDTPLHIGQKAIVTLRTTGQKPYVGIIRRISILNQYMPEEKLLYITVNYLPKTASIGEQAEVLINLP